MLTKTVEVKATTTTDLGEFTAIAAAYSVDRMNERIIPGAFTATIDRWKASGKRIPLHWDHLGDAANVIGTVDPATMREDDPGLYVEGRLDIASSEVAKEAWRLMKSDAVSLSFGYLETDGADAKDGVHDIKAIDLFEISITPAPANVDTRLLSLKSAKNADALITGIIGACNDFLATYPDDPRADAVKAVMDRMMNAGKSITDDDPAPELDSDGADPPAEGARPSLPGSNPLRRKLAEALLSAHTTNQE